MVMKVLGVISVIALTFSCFVAVEAGLYPISIVCIATLAAIGFVTGRD